ncbi:hypothetical protein [Streptomyces pristinaespiralis]|uniref:hypothetical protein n=1 Tax=Streptomyces pristinaespiralis TaxID=38300 RepID=UPI0033CB3AC7
MRESVVQLCAALWCGTVCTGQAVFDISYGGRFAKQDIEGLTQTRQPARQKTFPFLARNFRTLYGSGRILEPASSTAIHLWLSMSTRDSVTPEVGLVYGRIGDKP